MPPPRGTVSFLVEAQEEGAACTNTKATNKPGLLTAKLINAPLNPFNFNNNLALQQNIIRLTEVNSVQFFINRIFSVINLNYR